MAKKPTYEELEQRVKELEKAEFERKRAVDVLSENDLRFQKKLNGNRLPNGDADTVTLNLSDIIDIQAIQSMMDDFFNLTNIGIAILDLHGKVLVATGWQDICTQFHRNHPESCRNCLESDLELSNGVEPGTYRLYRCQNNMWDMATPIALGDKLVGNLYLGQFLFEGETPDLEVFRSQARKYGFNEGEYLAALERVPRWSRETVNNAMTFYTKLSHMISELSYSNIKIAQTLKERDKLLNSLREREDFLKILINAIPTPVFCKDRDGKYLWFNNAFETFFGETKERLIGKSVFDINPPELAKIYHAKDEELFNSGGVQLYDFQVKNAYGKLRDVIFNKAVFTGSKGAVTGLIGAIMDITERKQAEEALQESEARYARAVRGTSDGLWDWNVLTNEDYLSPRWKELLGYEDHELTNRYGTFFSRVHPDDTSRVEAAIQAHLEQNVPYNIDHRLRTKSGDYRWFNVRGNTERDNQGKALLMSGAITDITERKQTEEALRESEEQYRTLMDNLPVAVYRNRPGPEGKFLMANPAFCKMFGFKNEEEVKKVTPADLYANPKERKQYSDNLIEKGVVENDERTLLKKDGTPVYTLITSRVVYGKDGEVSHFDSIILDISEQKLSEEALRESEGKYRNILESIEEGYYETDLAGNFTFFNDAMCRVRGYSRDELMGMNNRGYMDPATAKKVFEAYSQVYTTGRAIYGYEWETIRKDGTKGYVEVSASLMKNPEDKPIGFRGIVRDVTERKFAEEEKKRLEAQLQEGLKMGAIATLAGGVAHEFNNALMGIMGNIELLKMNFSDDGGIDKQLESMKGAGHRMSHLTAQLLAYAEGGKYQPQDLKLDAFVIQTLPILQHNLNSAVRVETHFPRDISYIKADYTQMQMVLSAILANSNEAIEDTGLIKIAAENIDLDEDFINHRPGLKPGPYVCLTVEDDGEGMDEETKDGIFEPFFTTKFQGRGMGMAAVHGIVMNHDGWISVDSELGRGTKVRIYLPAIEVEVEKPKKAKPEVATGSGTILMIEDEDVVIEVTQAMLEMLGYRVMVAKTGKDAIHIAETFDGQIDLALLDINLPDIDGRNLYPLIMKARSNLKVVVFSGYSIDGPAREILDAGAQDFIQKPFSIATLSEKLKEVFEGKQTIESVDFFENPNARLPILQLNFDPP